MLQDYDLSLLQVHSKVRGRRSCVKKEKRRRRRKKKKEKKERKKKKSMISMPRSSLLSSKK
jgi:hypothetical protein